MSNLYYDYLEKSSEERKPKKQKIQKLLPAIMAAEFCLLRSKELKCGGVYYSDIKDMKNCIKISFEDASEILMEFIETAIKENDG